MTGSFHVSASTDFADYSCTIKEVCLMNFLEPQPLWELFCLTGEPLAYMLYRSIEENQDNYS